MNKANSSWLPMVCGLILALASTGCITVGRPFPHDQLTALRPGVPMTEVKAQFGEPVRTGVDDGALSWTYLHLNASILGEFSGRDLLIKFDGKKRVVSYSYHTSDTSEKLPLAHSAHSGS